MLKRKIPVQYPGWESNPHSRKNWILNPARLPVPPPGQVRCKNNILHVRTIKKLLFL